MLLYNMLLITFNFYYPSPSPLIISSFPRITPNNNTLCTMCVYFPTSFRPSILTKVYFSHSFTQEIDELLRCHPSFMLVLDSAYILWVISTIVVNNIYLYTVHLPRAFDELCAFDIQLAVIASISIITTFPFNIHYPIINYYIFHFHVVYI